MFLLLPDDKRLLALWKKNTEWKRRVSWKSFDESLTITSVASFSMKDDSVVASKSSFDDLGFIQR